MGISERLCGIRDRGSSLARLTPGGGAPFGMSSSLATLHCPHCNASSFYGSVAAGASIQYGYISAKSTYGQVSTSFGSGLFSYASGLDSMSIVYCQDAGTGLWECNKIGYAFFKVYWFSEYYSFYLLESGIKVFSSGGHAF
nr:hypothetical protein [Tanacetum cinerariifolium]